MARPREVVFDLVADERTRYEPRIRDADLLIEGPIGVGTRFRSVGDSVRRPVGMVVEITAGFLIGRGGTGPSRRDGA